MPYSHFPLVSHVQNRDWHSRLGKKSNTDFSIKEQILWAAKQATVNLNVIFGHLAVIQLIIVFDCM